MNDPQDLIYEQREVLWAKIRGYPWWPAYVSTVHSAQSPNDYQYTVIFFGDNTNSRLGPSKLRRFPDNYAQFFVKAKTNKKLKQSIQKAQQRLSQNHQNIKMYENIRNQILSKKKKGTVSQSRLSSSQKIDMEAPDLIKHKTQDISKTRKMKDKKKQSQIFQQQQSQGRQHSDHESHHKQKTNLKMPTIQNRRRRSQNILVQKQSPSKIEKLNIPKEQTPQCRVKRITRKAKQFQISPQISKQPQMVRVRNHLNSRQKMQSQSSERIQKQKNQDDEQSQQIQKMKVVSQTRGRRRGRKGRPPKASQFQHKVHLQQNPNQSSYQSQQIQQIPIPKRGRKRKIKTFLDMQTLQGETKPNNQIGSLTQQEAQKIKQNLGNRRQLTNILLSMPINTNNIKQILDLGVTLVLQADKTKVTEKIHVLLCFLKATLLHKYFPDNNKHRRKYQKLSKQRKKVALQHSEEQQNENNEQNIDIQNNKQQQDEQKAQKMQQEQTPKQKYSGGRKHKQNKQNSRQNLNSKEVKDQTLLNKKEKMKQIREKVVQKLQKMIKKAGVRQSTKNYAHIIQNSFQEAAELKIDSYKSVAYKRMRNFKTKLAELSDNMASSAEVKDFIESVIQSYELQNRMPVDSEKNHLKG